ncbi:LLM class flavin-dependent oxidoreductase [Actinocatenispora rupis]|uniref:N5,N10-methylene tetrahydromethanopterin reductase n=1 Tax=Actinocatenispora rupis TaxID=519421 RepID=A0A8J3JGP9_9ACTN|nr:LLM class flavin-dependent oxidoreductase [Actinocatenispora rupis]GID14568.1 N5,N10-methylene tetrahydromethanopterin reductase [Actinocatenispora rupis]
MTGVRIGLLLPTRERTVTGRHDPAALIDLARAAERAGLDSVWVGDSLTARPRPEPLTLLAAVAAATERITVGTAALTAALRPPLPGAHAVATLDRIARGRLVLALGAGFPLPETAAEFAAAGVPFRERVGRLDETVRIWRTAWTSGAAYDGRYWSLPATGLVPPHSAGGPPLWLAGGDRPGVLRRVAETYDGWLPYLPDDDAYAAAWRTVRAEHRTAGLYATVHLDADPDRAGRRLDDYTRGYYGRPVAEMARLQAFRAGTAAAVADWLSRYVDAGARHLVLRLGTLFADEQWPRLAEELLPLLRGRFGP